MIVEFSTKNIEWVDPQETADFESVEQRAIPVSLKEMVQYFADPDFQEPIYLALDLSLEDIHKLLLMQYPLYYGKSRIDQIAKIIGIAFLHRDRKSESKKVRRVVHALEDSAKQKKLRVASRFSFFSKSLKEQIESCTGACTVSFLEEIVGSIVSLSDLKGEERFKEELEAHLVNISLVALSVFESPVFEYWYSEIFRAFPDTREFMDWAMTKYFSSWLHVAAVSPSSSIAAQQAELSAQRKALAVQYEEDAQALQALIQEMTKPKTDEAKPETSTPILAGKRVLVVGDEPRAPIYRQLVEWHGGEFEFVSGYEKNRQAILRFSAVDGIVFVTAYVEHAKWYALKSHANMRRVVLMNRAGVLAMEEALKELAQKLAVI
ncbi:DUF2325 domain-containing protein [Sulfoacidibacillus thermotolerans]|uniref:DUF2325 domain-containing protein n=1 Tax=Sulfoacidibacillus thermotolerans TaxID=1765684 RepID=A0A2U3D3L1_SULT2|nr:DUF2325 domain-containing protein [Sulfoacidibacillus thermotolerans]PWI55855.1 hypothetical protein BM613_13300 [Sulfoacidibacillus thermotolerans]